MPAFAHARSRQLIQQATLPATMAAGLLVGLCTFPCSGGIYVSVITLLNAKTTIAWGVAYLFLYNLMFVLPLVVILLAVGNKGAARVWAQWERSHAGRIRLWYGLIMVAMGLGLVFWVIPG
jgi:cytochrome c biogenesis protein CcdA